jgi:hypothetical protein
VSGGFATRWPVLQRHAVADADLDDDGALRQDVAERWVAEACAEYLGRCAALPPRAAVRQHAAPVPAGRLTGRPATVAVTARATEVRPSSFTLAVRVRATGGGDDDRVAGTTCLVWLEDPATGEPVDLGEAVLDDLVALDRAARHIG